MQWLTIYKKEILENWRNFKWIWVPIVFILLGISDPISTYYLPKIIEMVGGMPEGTVFEMPEMAPTDIFMMSIGQFGQIGILITVLASMSLISGERKSGVAELILVRPIPSTTYITAKWVGSLTLIWFSYLIGTVASVYYTNILFGEIPFKNVILAFIFFGVWISFVVSLSIFVNTFFASPGVVGFITIGSVIALSIVTSIFSNIWSWSPSKISSYLPELLKTGTVPSEFWGAFIASIVCIILFLAAAVYVLNHKEVIKD